MPVLGLLLLLGTAQPGASAAAAPASTSPFLEAGKQLYVALEYEKALEQLNRARTAPNTSVADLVAVEEYTGLIKFDLGDIEGARTAFRTALALDPHAEIPADVSPKIQSEWQAMRREMIKTRRTAERQDHPAPEVASSTTTPAGPTSVVPTPPTTGAATPAVGGLTTPTPAEPTPVTYALLGGGAVGLVAGAILGGASIASYNGALSSAALGRSPSSQANASVTEGRIGLGLAMVGAAAAVTGIVRWVSDRPSSETSVAAR